MASHRQPSLRIFFFATDTPASWQREVWEWLFAVAAVGAGLWISRAIGQAIFGLTIGLWRIG